MTSVPQTDSPAAGAIESFTMPRRADRGRLRLAIAGLACGVLVGLLVWGIAYGRTHGTEAVAPPDGPRGPGRHGSSGTHVRAFGGRWGGRSGVVGQAGGSQLGAGAGGLPGGLRDVPGGQREGAAFAGAALSAEGGKVAALWCGRPLVLP